MIDFIIIMILIVILAIAEGYIYKEKKDGRKCIGCPNSCSCNKKTCK